MILVSLFEACLTICRIGPVSSGTPEYILLQNLLKILITTKNLLARPNCNRMQLSFCRSSSPRVCMSFTHAQLVAGDC